MKYQYPLIVKETKRFGSLMREPLNIKVNGKSISTPTGLNADGIEYAPYEIASFQKHTVGT
jgi:hypothetical protein